MSDAEPRLTPAMQRYLEVKKQHPDAILLFRMGDFYELFYEDAQIAARVVGLTLTSRDKGSPNPIPMAGFPYHQLDNYLRKLIQAGYRASVCEQVEDPKLAKGLVSREVSRIVTPGTLTDDALLDPRESNFLATVYPEKDRIGLAWLELSTGRFVTTDIELKFLSDELARLRPAECLIPDNARGSAAWQALATVPSMLVAQRPAWCFVPDHARSVLLQHFETATLEGFDLDQTSPGITAAGALLEYVCETQKSSLHHIVQLEPYRRGTNLMLDESTRRSLELTRTIREGKREGSLLAVIDETVSPMGARLLADWLSNPLTDVVAINRRLDAVTELTRDPMLCQDIRDVLKQTYDLQRLTARISTGRATPRDLGCLASSLEILPKIKAKLSARRSELLQELEVGIDLCPDIRNQITLMLVDEPPLSHLDGGVIRDGFSAELNELRDLSRGGKEWIAKYQAQESARLGLPNLKVGFNRVFGYYLEVTSANADKVPPEYIRKQTLKNQERFITPELKTHEDRVLRAETQAHTLEEELFLNLREQIGKQGGRLRQTADILAQVDVLVALATLAVSSNYCRPEVLTESVLEIEEGRHPVLDRLQPSGQFVPNDVRLGESNGLVQIITGPNMAGKSTYIRQAALIVIMAQMGSFVPARRARIGIADRIFARVGASDELSKGQSTFMVEMTETARILNAASERSIVILDEIGRGTSTYDGISLAWSVTEFLHDAIACRTMFATHYHELTQLTSSLKNARNWNVAVREDADNVIFLHKIVEGPADKSYGIHVARLAGVPMDVVERARAILQTLESDHLDPEGRPKVPDRPKMVRGRKRDRQLTLFAPPEHPLIDTIKGMNLEDLTASQALETLHRWRAELAQPK
ncbi:MAG: mutS 2 [Planctomycetaceae bacterium]|nr:mutS 2 [Planctomycetaceae bacterium]